MAKLRPDGGLSGSIGGAVYAKQPDGSTNVRSKGGATRDKVMKSASMARTRENFYDFGRASGCAKVIRLCLREMVKGHKLADPILSGRLNASCARILRSDPESVRGARLMLKGDLALLKEFEFFKASDNAFHKVFGAPVVSEMDAATGFLRLTIAPFDPSKRLRVPAGATHFKILFNGSSVNFEKRQFDCQVNETDYHSLDAGIMQPIELSHELTVATARLLIATMGIVFYKALENGSYERIDGGVMKIVEVKKVELDGDRPRVKQEPQEMGAGVSRNRAMAGAKEESPEGSLISVMADAKAQSPEAALTGVMADAKADVAAGLVVATAEEADGFAPAGVERVAAGSVTDETCTNATFTGLSQAKQQRCCAPCVLPANLMQAMSYSREKVIAPKISPTVRQQETAGAAAGVLRDKHTCVDDGQAGWYQEHYQRDLAHWYRDLRQRHPCRRYYLMQLTDCNTCSNLLRYSAAFIDKA